MTKKQRPLVDNSAFDLAAHWMQDYETISDREDLTWELADEIQIAIENFFDEAIENGRLKEGR
jgi:hypothetical protein